MSWDVYGEPDKDKVKITIYLPRWLRIKLKKSTDNQSVFVERTLMEYHGWVKPRTKKKSKA